MAATACVALGCGVGLRWPGDGVLAACVAAVCVLAAAVASLGWLTAGGRASRRGTFALLGCAGWALGASGAHDVSRDCRTALTDGARVAAVGVLEGVAQAGGTTLLDAHWLRVPDRTPCRGLLRVRLPPKAGVPAPGLPVRVEGRWWAFPHVGRWPAPPERGGTLAVSSIAEAGERARGLAALRGAAQARIRSRFGGSAGMVEAVLLARREALDPAVRDAFAASGLSHLLAISGTHVGMIAAAALMLARMARVPARSAAAASGGLTAAYVMMLGAPHAAARAALQVLLVVSGRVAQRPADPFALMATAALALLALRPLALLDAGFQLSFAGVFGLLAFQAPLRSRMPVWVPGSVAATLSATAAATAATMPIAALHFGQVSFIGLAANLVAVPLLAVAVPAAALALAGDWVHPVAGAFLAGGARVPFVMLERVADVAAAVPGGHAYWGASTVTAALLGTAAFVLLLRTSRGRGVQVLRGRGIAVAAAGALVLVAMPLPTLRRAALEIHAIDVGQGDAIAVRTPAGRWLLIDTGPRTDRFDAGASRIAPYLRDHGARRLEVMVLTHPDLDHIGGAPALLQSFPVGALIDPALPAAKEGFYATMAAARASGVRWYSGRAGREITVDGVTLSILAPEEPTLDGPLEANDLSVVFRLAWGGFAALFTGDAPRSVENALVALHDTALAVDLLKVGHHGSRTSTGDSLLMAARPRLAIVSVGARNRYGHPDPGVVARLGRFGVRILRTDENGSIVVRIGPSGDITYSSER